MHTLSTRAARRLALLQAGLLKPDWLDLPRSAGRGDAAARRAAHRLIEHLGYLQLDTVAVAGARSHAIVLLSRLPGFPADLGENLLQPGEPLFEYWGHEVCWLPLSLYPLFGWRRRLFRHHPWWGDVIGKHPDLARDILKRVREDGPLRSSDLEGESGAGWWRHKPAKNVAVALWSAGELVVRERRGFQRTFDLPERVLPGAVLEAPEPPLEEALKELLLVSLRGHGWAETPTLAQTFRLRRLKTEARRAVAELAAEGRIVPCRLEAASRGERPRAGWIRPADLEMAARLESVRPARGRPVLLSPFDPILWDRPRVERLFGFDFTIEIFVPPAKRRWGYYCLPVLAGEEFVARVDLKADRRTRRLRVVARHLEVDRGSGGTRAARSAAVTAAVADYAAALGFRLAGLRSSTPRPGAGRRVQ
jgi:uncharacterized protein YcaQ